MKLRIRIVLGKLSRQCRSAFGDRCLMFLAWGDRSSGLVPRGAVHASWSIREIEESAATIGQS